MKLKRRKECKAKKGFLIKVNEREGIREKKQKRKEKIYKICCIFQSKQFFHMPFAGRNHLFQLIHIFNSHLKLSFGLVQD